MGEESAVLREMLTDETTGTSGEGACSLCGLPLGSVDAVHAEVDGSHRFCCPGCRQVFVILSGGSGSFPADFRSAELFRACVEAGIIPGPRTIQPESALPQPQPDLPALHLVFMVSGMWCPACAWLIEEALKRMPGVVQPRVSFLSDTVRLEYLPHMIAPAEIMLHVEKLGYRTSNPEEDSHRYDAKRYLLRRLGVSAILSMNAMVLSYALYSGFIRELAPMAVAYFSYPLLLMTAPVVFYGGMPILRRAWNGIRLGNASMDTLIAVSTLAAFCYSVIQTAKGSIHLYFDTAAMLITIVLLGRYIEMHTRERVLAASGLDEISPQKVRLAEGPAGRWVGAETARPGDHFRVYPGERVPLDGQVTEGKGLVNQSVLTGELTPVARERGQQVMAGSLLTDGRLEIEATHSYGESSLRQIIDLVANALDQKGSGEEAADSMSRLFVPATMAASGITGLLLWFFRFPADEILLRCLTVLLISCPCALGIAVPLVKVVVIGLGRRKGILIRNPGALERIPDLDTLILDKTGTVTEGSFVLREIVTDEPDESGVLFRIAALEADSSHFLAREIVRCARERSLDLRRGTAVKEFDGLGVTGVAEGKTLFVGNRRLLSQCGAGLPVSLDEQAIAREHEGMTIVFFGWDGAARGFLVFGDWPRAGARELIDALQRRGIKILLLSGDGNDTTGAVAGSLGITGFLGQTTPSEKAEMIRKLQDQGHRVGMVGDGVNDAGALAQADVAFAMGAGHGIMREASDLMIPGGRPDVIIDAFELSALSTRTVRQNLSFAFLYNIIAIPVAAAGLLNPVIAVTAMFMSSLTVIGNSLRISRRKIGGDSEPRKVRR